MALTESNMLPLGTTAPDFNLPDTISGETKSFDDVKSDSVTVLMFICNHCPYVIHVLPEIKRLTEDYIPKGVKFVAISSNDVENYPDDHPDKMKLLAEQESFDFPYLYDEDQSVAKAYDAACTPDFYIFNNDDALVYRGRLDSSRPGNDLPLDGADLREALDALLEGQSVRDVQYPSAGCNIKWKN